MQGTSSAEPGAGHLSQPGGDPFLPFGRHLVVSVDDIPEAGAWDLVFHRKAPLELEIGFGWDLYTLDQASARHGVDFVGMEYDRKRVLHFVRHAAERGLANVRAVHGEAIHCLPRMFSPGQISSATVLFPDPWHKAKQRKHRLLGPGFTARLLYFMAPSAALVVATDSEPYRDYIHESLSGVGGTENALAPAPWAGRLPGRPETKFERIFRSQSKPVYYFHHTRRADLPEGITRLVREETGLIPRRTSEMPHAVMDPVAGIARLVESFQPVEWREGRTLFKVLDLWRPVRSSEVLLESVVVHDGHDARFFVEIDVKPDKTVIGVSFIREVERNELLFRHLRGVVRLFQRVYPEARLLRHNLPVAETGGAIKPGEDG